MAPYIRILRILAASKEKPAGEIILRVLHYKGVHDPAEGRRVGAETTWDVSASRALSGVTLGRQDERGDLGK